MVLRLTMQTATNGIIDIRVFIAALLREAGLGLFFLRQRAAFNNKVSRPEGVDKSREFKYVHSMHAHGDEPLSLYLRRVFVPRSIDLFTKSLQSIEIMACERRDCFLKLRMK